jgi:hypothetical protein
MTCTGVADLGAETALDALFLVDLIFCADKVNGLHGTVTGAVVTAGADLSVNDKHGINSFLLTKGQYSSLIS